MSLFISPPPLLFRPYHFMPSLCGILFMCSCVSTPDALNHGKLTWNLDSWVHLQRCWLTNPEKVPRENPLRNTALDFAHNDLIYMRLPKLFIITLNTIWGMHLLMGVKIRVEILLNDSNSSGKRKDKLEQLVIFWVIHRARHCRYPQNKISDDKE